MRQIVVSVEIVLLVLALLALGIVHFSKITPAGRAEIQLEAGLEQLYYLQATHFRRHGSYFALEDETYRDYLQWLDLYRWEARVESEGFRVVVHADLDADGESGSWGIDSSAPTVRRIVQD
ncbi:MAG: hypothetical protein CME24_22070 [Gemmatimonadetes bacterium]|nr:hypothetical protein [Gemmatimonadota bacterium]MEE3039310.1 hypothetical protein [Candidatus Latescibacterota bacterium]